MIRDHSPARGPASRLRRLAPWMMALLLVVPLVGGLGAPPGPARGDNLSDAVARQKALAAKIAAQKVQIARLAASQRTLNASISETSAALNAVNADLGAVKKKIAKLAAAIAEVQAEYDALVAQIADLDAQIAETQQLEDEKAKELAQRKAVLAQRLRAAYATDRTSALETILSSASFADALTEMGYLIDFGRADKQIALQIKDDQAALATLQATLQETRTQTDQLRRAAADQRAQLDARLADQKTAKAQLASLKAETARRLAQQQANYKKLAKTKAAAQKLMEESVAAQKALQRKIAALIARQRAAGRIPSQYNGTLSWPMAGVVTQEYGCTGFAWEPASGGCRHWHNGIDIAAPMYTPVRAAGDGRVVFAGANPYDRSPKAWIVIIAHSGALQTWYAHLDNGSHSIPVSVGQWVTKGQVIGYEGMTGRTTGPHLHYMVELNGGFSNPRLFL